MVRWKGGARQRLREDIVHERVGKPFFPLIFGCFRMKAHFPLQNGRNVSLNLQILRLESGIWERTFDP